MHTERRRTRSTHLAQALDYQLAACRADAGLEAIVLGDDDGLVVAAAGPRDACAELAAVGTAAGDACSFAIDGARMHVIARGGAPADRRRQLERAAAGAHRILAA
ncbi:MAG: hypothetical protein R3B06_28215 [Kofleriaceae bacterium]